MGVATLGTDACLVDLVPPGAEPDKGLGHVGRTPVLPGDGAGSGVVQPVPIKATDSGARTMCANSVLVGLVSLRSWLV